MAAIFAQSLPGVFDSLAVQVVKKAHDQLVVRALDVFRNIAVNTVIGEMIGHSLWVAVVPRVNVTFYKFRCSHHSPPVTIRSLILSQGGGRSHAELTQVAPGDRLSLLSGIDGRLSERNHGYCRVGARRVE